MDSEMSVITGDDSSADVRQSWHPPDNEVPAVLDPVVLAATADAAVTLAPVRVFSTGVEITVECRRRVPLGGDPTARAFIRQRVFVGVELADGRRVVAERLRLPTEDYSLRQRSGGSDDLCATFVYWFSPAPPPGDLVVVVHAVDLDLPEARVTLRAADLAVARDRVVELWPWAPPPAFDYEPDPEPVPPAGGWFAERSSLRREFEPCNPRSQAEAPISLRAQ